MALVGGEKLDSHNLRDFLRIKEEDRHSNLNQSTSSNGGHNPSATKRVPRPRPPPPADEPLQRIQSNRTLLDIIREDQTSGVSGGRRSWRKLREKMRLRSRGTGGSAWSSTVPIPASDVPLNNNHNYNNRTMMMMTRRPSTRFNANIDSAESTQLEISSPPPNRAIERANGRFEHTSSLTRRRLIRENNHLLHEEEEDDEEPSADTVEEEEEVDGTAEQPVRMSLMALLAETDRQMGLEGSAYIMNEEEDEVEEEESAAVTGGVNGVGYNSCCVCMVRHKGAAFIPCGHTFCRLCSRELWVLNESSTLVHILAPLVITAYDSKANNIQAISFGSASEFWAMKNTLASIRD
ncbi:hypothetical protein DH2020_000021 [Rehmannia glutinosa]|uniref:RING-type domain-containing protein n=1 Tax=Rehmannia glutinosa TaxID=99300 RepID=A0ABR0XVF2_REHGL